MAWWLPESPWGQPGGATGEGAGKCSFGSQTKR